MLTPFLAQAQIHKPYFFPPPKKDTSKVLIFNDVTAGPYFTAGITRQNVDLPGETVGKPWSNTPRFSYMIGGTIDLSVNTWIGLDFTALYDARDLYLASAGDSNNVDISLGYVEFQPALRIFWLLIGLAFDIPMSGSATANVAAYQHPDQPLQPYSANLEVQTSDLTAPTELRGTLSVPILQGDDAALHLIVSASYPLAKSFATAAPAFDTTATPTHPAYFSGPYAPGQGPLISLQAGLAYQFDLLH